MPEQTPTNDSATYSVIAIHKKQPNLPTRTTSARISLSEALTTAEHALSKDGATDVRITRDAPSSKPNN